MRAIERLLANYIQKTERVFAEIKLSSEAIYVERKRFAGVVDMAKRYLEDAKYYEDGKKFETGLVSVVYSEGLLDALKMLNIAEFQWPTEKRKRRGI